MSGTAEIHDATLTPTKLELLAGWLPGQPWFEGPADDLTRVASFRFVDPDGEVGVETILVGSGGVTYQVPVTYRNEPLEEATLPTRKGRPRQLEARFCRKSTCAVSRKK